MQTQLDYEAVITLAVFRSIESAQTANEALHAASIEHTQRPLQSGRYQVADPTARNFIRVILGAAIVGAIVGGIIGVVLAMGLVGAEPPTTFFLAVAGAGGGAIIGGLIGLASRARYDDDVASTIEVPADPPAVLVSTYTSPSSPNHRKVRAILQQAGAIAFLDGTTYAAEEQQADGAAIP